MRITEEDGIADTLMVVLILAAIVLAGVTLISNL